jgi:hypothetical protein
MRFENVSKERSAFFGFNKAASAALKCVIAEREAIRRIVRFKRVHLRSCEKEREKLSGCCLRSSSALHSLILRSNAIPSRAETESGGKGVGFRSGDLQEE